MRYLIGGRCIRRLARQTGLDIVSGIGRGGWGPWLEVWTRDGQHYDIRRKGRDAVQWTLHRPSVAPPPPDEPSLDELFIQDAQRKYFSTLSLAQKERWLEGRVF